MLCSHFLQNAFVANKALPIVIFFDFFDIFCCQVRLNAFVTKNKWTRTATKYFTTLTTPSTEEFRAIVSFAKLSRILLLKKLKKLNKIRKSSELINEIIKQIN